jgi:hypothetical protein
VDLDTARLEARATSLFIAKGGLRFRNYVRKLGSFFRVRFPSSSWKSLLLMRFEHWTVACPTNSAIELQKSLKFLKGRDMKKTLSLLAFCSIFSVMAFGESWSGKLIDANCYSQQKKASSCDATSTTTAFALDVSGKLFTLDAVGNSKAATAMTSRADRAADPNNPQSKEVIAKVSGTEKGGTITVETIDVP